MIYQIFFVYFTYYDTVTLLWSGTATLYIIVLAKDNKCLNKVLKIKLRFGFMLFLTEDERKRVQINF